MFAFFLLYYKSNSALFLLLPVIFQFPTKINVIDFTSAVWHLKVSPLKRPLVLLIWYCDIFYHKVQFTTMANSEMCNTENSCTMFTNVLLQSPPSPASDTCTVHTCYNCFVMLQSLNICYKCHPIFIIFIAFPHAICANLLYISLFFLLILCNLWLHGCRFFSALIWDNKKPSKTSKFNLI